MRNRGLFLSFIDNAARWQQTVWILSLGGLLLTCSRNARSIAEEFPEVKPVPGITLLHDEFQGRPIIIAGSRAHNLILSFERSLPDGSVLSFLPAQSSLPVLMTDEEGNEWDLFGRAVSGPRRGQQLRPARSFMGYWFAFASFFPEAEIYGMENDLTGYQDVPSPGWLVNTDFVFQGTAPENISAIDQPRFFRFEFRKENQAPTLLRDEDLIIALRVGEEVRIYPHAILDYHEIVNDVIGGLPVAVSYCPLTGTAAAWDRRLGTGTASFGVSGMVFNNNIMPYDRQSGSLWTQLDGRCVRGAYQRDQRPFLPLVVTTWKTWLTIYRDPLVLSTDTGFNRDYTRFPYGDYRTNHETIFYPIAVDDPRLPRKERVHAVIYDGKARVYTFDHF